MPMMDQPLGVNKHIKRWADVEQGDVFLGSNAIVIENLAPNPETNRVEIPLPENFDEYSFVKVYVSDQNSACGATLNVNQSIEEFNKKKRDLALAQIKEEGKIYNTFRSKVELSAKGISHAIPDADGTDIVMVDDISTLFELQKVLIGYSFSHEAKNLSEFDFLVDWFS